MGRCADRCCCRLALTVVMVERLLTLLLSLIGGRRGGGGGERHTERDDVDVVVVTRWLWWRRWWWKERETDAWTSLLSLGGGGGGSQFDSEVFAGKKTTSAAFACWAIAPQAAWISSSEGKSLPKQFSPKVFASTAQHCRTLGSVFSETRLHYCLKINIMALAFCLGRFSLLQLL